MNDLAALPPNFLRHVKVDRRGVASIMGKHSMAHEHRPDKTAWHQREAHELAREQRLDPTLGLHEAGVRRRVENHGGNERQSHELRGPLALLAERFKDLMVPVLLAAAAVISGVIGGVVDTMAIVVIVLLSALMGFVQTWHADRAMAALQQVAATQATVLRDPGRAGPRSGAGRHGAAGSRKSGAGPESDLQDRTLETGRVGHQPGCGCRGGNRGGVGKNLAPAQGPEFARGRAR